MARLPANSVDAIVTDPPYGLSDHKPEDVTECIRAWLAGEEYRPNKRGFMGRCYHPDTEVLTRDGWKKFPEVRDDDLIASLNPATKEIEYVSFPERHDYDFDGELVHIRHRSGEQMVTPNHRVYCATPDRRSFVMREAENLPRVFHLSNQGRWAGTSGGNVQIGKKTLSASPFFFLMGLFLGDGWALHRTSNEKSRKDSFGFTVLKSRKVDAIRRAFRDAGIPCIETALKSNRFTFISYDEELVLFFKSLGKTQDKHIPEWAFEYDAKELESLYEGLIASDGCVQWNGRQHVFHTTSKRLADGFQRLCLHVGRSATMHTTPGHTRDAFGYTFESRDLYTLSVLQPEKRLYVERDGRPQRGSPSAVSKVHYRGRVYCLTLKTNHIMYVRWNGKPVWSGNSWDAWVPGPEVWREALRVLKPGGYVLAFSGTRTLDLMTLAIRLSGFEMRDALRDDPDQGGAPLLAWVYSQGFPKSLSVSKALAGQGAAPESVEQWKGWGTALKPAWEPVIIGRKPLGSDPGVEPVRWDTMEPDAATAEVVAPPSPAADDDLLAMFDHFAASVGGASKAPKKTKKATKGTGPLTPSRFYYCGKATAVDRQGSKHPTVKPIELMTYLCRIGCPPGGVVLDPFAGSGTTGAAAIAAGRSAILIEREDEYAADIRARLSLYLRDAA
jgi:site-specific DNA-methyltransferase (adenine-specific)